MLLLKLNPTGSISIENIYQSFNTPVNSVSSAKKVTLTVIDDQLYFVPAGFDVTSDLFLVDEQNFKNKLKDNELRFVFDPACWRTPFVRGICASIISQTYADDLRRDLINQPDPDFLAHLQGHLLMGMLYVAPVAMVLHFALQYVYYYKQTGIWLNDIEEPQLKQMLYDSLIVGIQSLVITLNFALVRVCIPLVLQAFSLQPSGPLIHFMIAPLFGLMFATTLLLFDLMIYQTRYGKLALSPVSNFLKNFTIGTSLYLIQLIPGLDKLTGAESLARAALAFTVPNVVNAVYNLPDWYKRIASQKDTRHSVVRPSYSNRI